MEIPEKTAPRLFLIDAYALIYRAFYAFIRRPLINSSGENTSAPFGFAQFLERMKDEYEPDYLAVVFDSGMSHREKEYPEYKATREKMPDELRASLPRIRAMVEAYNDPIVELEGYEADDVIGTLARKAAGAGLEAVIVSGDKDFYQLVGPGIHLMNPGRGGPTGVEAEWVEESNADEKFGVPPSQVVDYLALIGDSSDNVPGAPGIGPKTAVTLLGEHGSVESLLEVAEEIGGKRARTALTEHADDVRISKWLVTIMQDLPVDLDLEALKMGRPDYSALRDLFVELEFRTLAEKYTRLAMEAGAEEGKRTHEARYALVTDADAVAGLVERIRRQGWFALDTETTSLDPMRAGLVGASLSLEEGEAFYLPFAHEPPAAPELDFEAKEIPNLPPLDDDRLRPLVDVLEDPEVRKIGQNLKYDLIVLAGAGVDLRGVWFDTMVASYVLDPSRREHGLDALAVEILAYKPTAYKEVAGKGRREIPFAEVDLEAACEYACEDADCTLRLYEKFEPELEEQKLETLFHELEMPLVPVLARMERNGIRIDEAFFGKMSEKLNRELELIQEEIWKLAGEEFNINSTIQLREILFEKMELPVKKRTKTGPSTDASVLEALAEEGHDIPRLMLEYRELEKLRSTYVDALPKLVHWRTKRIHTSFNQTVAATGRLSSSDPNLQNIPIRTDLGREIRKGFVAEPGNVFLGVDYSQIELRILAHFSGDDAFVTAFREGIDVHRQTAAVIFDTGVDDVTPAMRAQAKTINFATLYGQGPWSLARQLGISQDEAKDFIDQYFERFAGVRAFLDEQVEKAAEQGYVETLLGRRRYIPELRSRNWNVRQFGQRVAQNTPIQGTAADLIKKAMIEIQDELDSIDTGAMMLLQVHDELLFEVPEAEVDPVREMVVVRMEGALELDVPLVADWGVGASWYDAKG
ncbi:MAG: DNA polymerase I [Gemmatimonadota bacterium]